MGGVRPEWLTVAQCAAEVYVSRMTMYRLIHAGAVPVTKIGNSMRIKRSDWERYLAERRSQDGVL